MFISMPDSDVALPEAYLLFTDLNHIARELTLFRTGEFNDAQLRRSIAIMMGELPEEHILEIIAMLQMDSFPIIAEDGAHHYPLNPMISQLLDEALVPYTLLLKTHQATVSPFLAITPDDVSQHQINHSPPKEFKCEDFVKQSLQKLMTAFEYRTALNQDPGKQWLMSLNHPLGLTISFQQVPGCVLKNITDNTALQGQLKYGMHFYITAPTPPLKEQVRAALAAEGISTFTQYRDNFIVFCPPFFTVDPRPDAIKRVNANVRTHFSPLVRACVNLGFPVPEGAAAVAIRDGAAASSTTVSSTLFAPPTVRGCSPIAVTLPLYEEEDNPGPLS